MTKKTEEKVIEGSDEIVVRDPQVLRPKELPLVVELPEGASLAQQAYAKVLNGYAYKNPTKWEVKKESLIAHLRSLKNAPDPVEDPNRRLKIGSNKLPA